MTTLESGYREDVGQVLPQSGMAAILGALHDIDDKRHYIAVDFPYDEIDQYNTDWHQGVWDKSWSRSLPPMVKNHKDDVVLGRAIHAQNVRGEDGQPVGRLVGRFSRTQEADDVFKQIQDGDWPGHSFHYTRAKSVPHPTVRGARRFVEAHMAEFGPVTFPAILGAKTAGIRSEEEIEVVSFDTLRDMFRNYEIDFAGYRSLVEANFPEMLPYISDKRAATVQLAPDQGRHPVHAPGNVGDGAHQNAPEHAHEMSSAVPGAPSLESIQALRDRGDIDDDGFHALVRQHYPHLAEHLRRSYSESAARAVLAQVFGEDTVRAMTLSVPQAGGQTATLGGHGDDGDGDVDTDGEARELVSAIVASIDASDSIAERGEDPDKRSDQDWAHMRSYIDVARCAALTLADIVGAEVGDRADKVSNESWDGDKARFSPEQYRRSALIDTGEGDPDSKERYHLPVREPDGTLNANGVHAAAAALAGARGALKASDEQKRAAARKLIAHYNTLKEDPPASIVRLAGGGGDDGGRSQAEEMTDEVRALLADMERRGRVRGDSAA
jgi:hypothetical protein